MRPGATYGADYVLYRDHPSAAHSSFCVLCLMGPRQAPEALSWGDVEAANRVATQVGRMHLLCYALSSPDAT